jgi:hypothetical protein
VGGTLNLTSGNITLGTNDLTISSGNAITGYSSSSYVVTNSTGTLKINNLTTARVFPIGKSATSYTPATIANVTGAADQFSARATNNILKQGTSGATVTTDVVGQTWFFDEAVAGGSIATITLQWNGSDELSGFDRTDCHVSHYISGAWDNPPGLAASGSDPYTVSRSGITSFSPFGVEEATPHPLPIELLFFNAKLNGDKKVDLTWATASETNNDFFTIEKTRDGISFESVALLDGKGNSRVRINYNELDVNPYEGVSYYRLKQTDFDGKYEYSSLVSVENSSVENNYLNVFPNPASGGTVSINIHGNKSEQVTVQLVDLLGKIVYSKVMELNNDDISTITMDQLPNLVPGIYHVIAVKNEKLYTGKVMMQ